MKFKNPGNYAIQKGFPCGTLDNLNIQDKDKISYLTDCNFLLLNSNDSISELEKLEVKWVLSIIYNNGKIFRLQTLEILDNTDTEILPTDEELKSIIKTTYENLQKAFDKERTEFKIFDSLVNIHSDTIELNLQRLNYIFPDRNAL